ncbi:MAG: DEAD/DEAH box helicase [Deltaproteobacteria bacterium]|nr:DEAD/DEAH box helicase [Deltaproteobacteria bacterium]
MDDAAIELELYEKFFIAKGLEPYPVQEEAIAKIFAGNDVLITVPTGTGKTLIAKAGILRALRSGKTAIYTTPLRALTEEKHRELCEDFGEENVGFATGDYKVNPGAPIQVLVAEILWNRIYGDRSLSPADVVIMDEGHYFNDPERGYVWETSIIGLDPRSQLIILSATVGYPERFCQWAYLTRKTPMALVRSTERKVPLYHHFKEQYLIETVRELHANGEVPAIIFAFSRKGCFEHARILKSCPRFVTDEERAQIEERSAPVLLETGLGPELEPLLMHGIGIHHAGILPRYRRLVEELTLDRLLKVVVSTETISAGINLPAKRVVFPSLRKFVRGKARLLRPAEYHQMSGRAGRPQFDTEGIAITLAPEEVVQEFRKEIKDLKRGGLSVDEAKIKKKWYMRARTEARAKEDVTWDPEIFDKLVAGQAAALYSQTKITAEQILAIGLPDLAVEALPGQALLASTEAAGQSAGEEGERVRQPKSLAEVEALEAEAEGKEVKVAAAAAPKPAPIEVPAAPLARPVDPSTWSAGENIKTVIDNLLLDDAEKRAAHKRLAQITANLRALGVLDEHGRQIKGEMIGKVRGVDGLFVYYCLMSHDLDYAGLRELVELLVDHDIIQKLLNREGDEKKRQWVLARMREMRRENPHVTFEDAEAEYDKEFPRELARIEQIHQAFVASVPHPELHGGKLFKNAWQKMEDEQLSFTAFVDKLDLAREEGSLFSYLARVMKVAKMLGEVTAIDHFTTLEGNVRKVLGEVDARVLDE